MRFRHNGYNKVTVTQEGLLGSLIFQHNRIAGIGTTWNLNFKFRILPRDELISTRLALLYNLFPTPFAFMAQDGSYGDSIGEWASYSTDHTLSATHVAHIVRRRRGRRAGTGNRSSKTYRLDTTVVQFLDGDVKIDRLWLHRRFLLFPQVLG